MIAYTRTLRAVYAEGQRPLLLPLLTTCSMLVLWFVWLATGEVTLHATSLRARVEAQNAAHPVKPPVEGVVVRNDLHLGAEVKEGDVLLVLDSRAEELSLDQRRAQRDAAVRKHAALEQELEAQLAALEAAEATSKNVVLAANARKQEAESMATLARKQDETVKRLKAAALVSDAEALRSQGDVSRLAAAAQAQGFETLAARSTQVVSRRDRLASIASLRRALTEAAGDVDVTKAAVQALEFDIERRSLRAPTSGVVAQVVDLPPGSTVALGQRVATIVPAGPYRVVTHYTPSDVAGRVRPGQRVTLRLDSFPWSQYGTVQARVLSAASEPDEGLIRVELGDVEAPATIALAHGLTGSAEVELEKLSPLTLLLRLSGQTLAAQSRQHAQQGAASPAPTRPAP